MAVKKKSILLTFVAGAAGDVDHYIVKAISDSIDYHPGQRLSKAEAKQLCDSTRWSVDIR